MEFHTFLTKVEVALINPIITLLALGGFVLFVYGVVEFIAGAGNDERPASQGSALLAHLSTRCRRPERPRSQPFLCARQRWALLRHGEEVGDGREIDERIADRDLELVPKLVVAGLREVRDRLRKETGPAERLRIV